MLDVEESTSGDFFNYMGEGFAVNIGHARWYRIGLLLFLMYLTAFVDRSNIGMAAPAMVKSFGLSSTAVGVLLSAFFWGYVITMVPAGWTVSRYSAKKVIIWALVVWSIMAILTGVVTSYNVSPLRLFVGEIPDDSDIWKHRAC